MATNSFTPAGGAENRGDEEPSPAGGRGAGGRGPLHLLVTAGSTHEKIDEVREWGNIFTGKTGLDLALAFLELGNVTLLTSNREHAREFDGYSGKGGMLGAEVFRTHAELRELLAERMTIGGAGGGVDVVAMTAAVADYRPSGVFRIAERRKEGQREVWVVDDVSAGKVKSTFDEIAVVGDRTEKLVDLFRGEWEFEGLLIKFKLEVGLSDEELVAVAGRSREASGADLIVANTLAMARPAGGGEGGAYLIDEGGATRMQRSELATRIAEWVRERARAR